MYVVNSYFLPVYLFFFIFCPFNFTNFNPIHLMFVVAVFGLLLHWRRMVCSIPGSVFFLYTLFLVVMFSYLICLFLFFNNEVAFSKLYLFIVAYIEVPLCALFITFMLRGEGIYKNNIYRLLLVVICFQFTFVLLCIVFDGVREWILLTSKIPNLNEFSNQFGALRSYGLGSGITYSLPMFMGFSCVVFAREIFNGHNISKQFLFFSFFLMSLATIVLNAQTGLVPVILYFVICCIFMLVNLKSFLTFLLVSVAVYIVYSWFGGLGDSISSYLLRTSNVVKEVNLLFNGTAVGFFSVIIEMHFLPDTQLEMIFGNGVELYGAGSDVGYIRDIHAFGFLGLFLNMLFVCILCFYAAEVIRCKFGFKVALALLLAIPFYYFKGMLFVNGDVFNAVFLIAIYHFVRRGKLDV